MKNMKKLLFSILLFFLIVTFSFGTFASSTTAGTTTLELVDDTVCTINVDDVAKFEKKITVFNKE